MWSGRHRMRTLYVTIHNFPILCHGEATTTPYHVSHVPIKNTVYTRCDLSAALGKNESDFFHRSLGQEGVCRALATPR